MKAKKIVSLLLTAALSLSLLAGCGSSDDESESSQESSSAAESSESSAEEESSTEEEESSEEAEDVSWYQTVETLDNPDVTIALYWEPDDEEQAAIDAFEEKYGGTVTVIVTGWNKAIAAIQEGMATGDYIDLTFTEGQYFYANLLEGYFQSIDEYVDDAIMDPVLMDQFKVNDHYYVFTNSGIGVPTVLFFNKTMFDEAGIEDPLTLYNKGEWTWDKFLEIWEYFNQDTDGDGEIDQWGLGQRAGRTSFAIANGSLIVSELGNGQLQVNIDSDKVVEYYEFLNSWGTLSKASEITTGIQGRQFAMEVEATTYMSVTKEGEDGDVIDFVPLPTADGSQATTPLWDHGYALVSGAQNPEGAAVLASMICQYKLDSFNDNLEENYSEAQQELYLSMMANSTYGTRNYTDVSRTAGESEALAGSPAQTIIETYKSQLEAEVEAYNQKVSELLTD